MKCIFCVCVSELSEPRRCCGTWLSRLACLFIYYFSSPNNEVYFMCVCFRVVGASEVLWNMVIKIGLSIYLLLFLP